MEAEQVETIVKGIEAEKEAEAEAKKKRGQPTDTE
jgi:hypothetical protein